MQLVSSPKRTHAMQEGGHKRWQKLTFLPQTTCPELWHSPKEPRARVLPPTRRGGLVALHVGTWFPARGE